MPAFKRAKKNPSSQESEVSDSTLKEYEPSTSGSAQAAPNAPNAPKAEDREDGVDSRKSISAVNTPEQAQALNTRQSWYGSTWPRTPAKAAPITQLATESISATSESPRKGSPSIKSQAGSIRSVARAPSLYMSPGVSTRSLPSTGTASKVSVSTPKLGHTESHDGTEDASTDTLSRSKEGASVSGKIPNSENTQRAQDNDNSDVMAMQSNSAGAEGGAWGMTSWLPAFRRGEATPSKPLPGALVPPDQPPTGSEEQSIVERQAAEAQEAEQDSSNASKPENDTVDDDVEDLTKTNRPKSWFGLWNGESSIKSPTTTTFQSEPPKAAIDTDLAIRAAAPQKTQALDAGETEQTPEERATATSAALAREQSLSQQDASRQGRWSWWSKAPADQTNNGGTVQDGKTANDGTKDAQPEDTDMTGTDPPIASAASTISRKRERPASSGFPTEGREDKISKQSSDGKNNATAAVNVLPDDSSAKGKEKPVQREHDSSNLLLPSLKQTYRAAESPGLLERLASYFFSSKTGVPKHPNLVKETPKIKHAIAIGVHGYFPAPLIRTVIGQPKGTSVRFATKAAEAIRDWAQKHGCSPKIDKIVLEGEGKIEERVELLWQLLIKQVELIREADFILVACHSQGVPVAVQLVAKLIKFGVLGGKKIGICAMAGVNLGPFADYKSRWIGGSAGELFDFASPESKVSVDYEKALAVVMKAGIKVVLVGSIDDQLVSMESATFGLADHPCFFRAVFINGQVHAPTFVVHLVGFALKLRNLGVPDHGLIRELSSSLAGSFTGDGHSRLYEDPALYDMAIEFALETTPCEGVALNIRRSASTPTPQNPYILPFAMRGVLEEQSVKSDLHDEMNELLSQFDEWKPSTKQLRDVKFRLEGVRSKI